MPPREKSTASLMREWRRVSGLSRAQAGARLSLSANTIRDIEQGVSRADDVLARVGLKKLIDDAK